MPTCPDCGSDVPETAPVCPACAPEAARSEDRLVATVVFSDLKGSTALGERFDAETLRRVLGRYFDEMRLALESRGGTVVKIIGDAIVAVFGPGEEPGDAALRAVEAVAESQAALATLNDRLHGTWGVRLTNRTGIATGELVVGEETGGNRVYTGPVMTLAETLEQNAPAMEALISADTHRLLGNRVTVEPVAPATPKGGGDPVPALRLVSVPTEATATRPDTAAVSCDRCGAENPPDARSCSTCGSLLVTADRGETRRTVTVVFADPRPGGAEGRPLPPTALKDVVASYFAVMKPILERHGATVETFIGDAVMAVFGLPVRHEDDALRAVRAADEMRGALGPLNADLERRFGVTAASPIGVNTGRVVAGDAAMGQRLVTGDAVNVAARLEQAAPAGEVYLGPRTHRLVRDAVQVETVEPLTLKGKSEPVPAFRLVAVTSGRATARRLDLPIVGRDDELELLDEVLRTSLEGASCSMVTIVGDAGVGKTRLIEELLGRAQQSARVLHGRCLPYGDGITFWPMVEAVQEAAEIRPDDDPATARGRLQTLVNDAVVADRLASMIGLGEGSFPVPELFWGAQRFAEIVSAERPLVVFFDDIHWAEPTFLDLVRHLVESMRHVPVLIVCAARRPLLEAEPEWSKGDRRHRIVLEPLSPGAVGEMLGNLLGTAGIDEAIAGKVAEAAQGNPLFAEQFMTMLLDEGRIRRDGDGWTMVGDVADIAVPPTIEALLAARLDRLTGDERHVADSASVIGRQFPTPAVEHLIDRALRPRLGAHLTALTGKQMVEPHEPDGSVYRFEHLLIRDAAYDGLLKQTRAVLHERFVEWADHVNRERGREEEFEEILGFHLEQAHRLWFELGPLDEHGIHLGERASKRLSSAGSRALGRGDMPAAASLLARAAAVLPTDAAARPGLLLQAGEARFEAGDFEAAEETIDAAQEAAGAIADRGVAASAEIELLRLKYLTGAVTDTEDVVGRTRGLIPELEAVASHTGLARAWRLLASVELAACRWGAAEEAAMRMVGHARDAGDHTMEMRVLPILTLFLQKGPTPVPEAMAKCREIVGRVSADRRAEAMALRQLAHLHAMSGDFSEARALCRRTRATLTDLGWAFDAALVSLDSGPIELLAGDPEAAEEELRRDHEALTAMGDHNFIALTAALLAEALYRRGRFDEADRFAAEAEEVAAPDDLGPQVLWRTVRAKLLARRGDAAEAGTLAEEALRLIETSDDPCGQADALMDLAEVLRLQGRTGEARAAMMRARRRYTVKGNSVGAARVDRELGTLSG